MSMKEIKNPIIPGFNPDPSVCKGHDGYYIATSTFEWFPGITIYYSKDLVSWEIKGQPLKSTKTINLMGAPDSGGLWAPHLTYCDGRYWLAITDVKNVTFFKDTLNYIMTADTVDGPWSEPVFINASGFDPAIFHDPISHKKYFLNMLWDHRVDQPNFHGILLQEMESETLKLIGEPTNIYQGTPYNVTEGSQIIFKDGYYYLVCAENGTGYRHSTTVLRSENVKGPYEKSPFWPLLTSEFNPEHPIQKAGHGSLVEANGNWYLVFLMARPLTERGYCQLGRETSMANVIWVDGWPRLSHESYLPPLVVEVASEDEKHDLNHPLQPIKRSSMDIFDDRTLSAHLMTLRGPLGKAASLEANPGCLRLYGRESLCSKFNQSILARRWQSRKFTAKTKLHFKPKHFQQMAGLVCYYNSENWMYVYVSHNEDTDSTVISILQADLDRYTDPLDGQYVHIDKSIDQESGIILGVEVRDEALRFFYQLASMGQPKYIGPVLPADHLSDDYIEQKRLVFTGSMVGICVQDMSGSKGYADFEYLSYEEED